MKKLITIYLVIATFAVNAQNLSGSLGTYSHNNVCNKYTNLNWEVSYKFEKRTDGIYLKYYNPKVTVAQNTLYATADKSYSKSELGLSSWPEIYSPSSLNVSVNCRLPNGKVELSGFACSTSNPYDLYEGRICATTLNGQEVNLSRFTLSVTKASYNPQPVEELDTIIKAKKSKTPNTSNTNTQDSDSNNPLGKSDTTTTQTTSQMPSLESQYEKLGIPANTPSYSKQEVTNQLVTQAGNLAGELLNEWGANQERKEQRLEAEYNAKISADSDAKTNKFKIEFLPLMARAQKGDEEARMILFFSSKALDREFYVKQRFQWLEEAIQNNNTDAMVFSSESLLITDENKGIALLEKAATLGSSDAMLKLATWYDKKEFQYGSKNGGENEQKALSWFNKAAEAGSPKAMFLLGAIYKYSRTLGYMPGGYGAYKSRIKYNIPKDEKLAFYWFSKASTLSNYKMTAYARKFSDSEDFNFVVDFPVNSFTPKVFVELAKIYKQGKVVPKDKQKAEEFEMAAKNYKISIENEFFSETKRYK